MFGKSRTPWYPAPSFRLQGRTAGIITRRFHRTGVSALSLARCGGSQAVRNSKELGAVFGLCGDVFDYVQLAPLHFKGQNHHIDNTQSSTYHTNTSWSDEASYDSTTLSFHFPSVIYLRPVLGCSLARELSLYKYLPDAVPRLRTLVSRIPRAFTADSDDNNHNHNTQPDWRIVVCGSEAPIESA